MSMPFTRILVLDAETRWSRKPTDWCPDEGGYSLSSITTEEYVRSPLFKCFGFGIHEYGRTGYKGQWYSHDELPNIFSTYDWSKTAVMCQNCVTGDHEVRTRDGWVRLDALQDGVDVLQWNPADNALTYTPAVVLRQPYTGEMYEWNTQYHKGMYTPNHRHYYKTPTGGDWRVATTEEMASMGQNNVYLPTAGILADGATVGVSCDEARFLEMVRADGHITTLLDAGFHFSKERKIARCVALLEELSFDYGRYTNKDGTTTIRTYANTRARQLASLLGAGRSKCLGEWVLRMPVLARKALLDEVQYWDGGVSNKGGAGQTAVASAKQQDIYWLTELAIMTGRSAKARYDSPNERGWSVEGGKIHWAYLRNRARAKLVEPPTKSNFSGTVYCLTTPTSAFLVRRGGATWVTGNSMFDCSILAWIYDVHPVFIFDTLSMARAVRGVEAGNSLKKLAEYFKLPPKGFAVNSSDGLWDLPKHIEKELAEYCVGSPGSDVELCEEIGRRLLTGEGFPDGIKRAPYPVKELRLIDMTVRMFTEPKLVLDTTLLRTAKLEENTRLMDALIASNAKEADLASNDKFAELLRQYGVEPPVKISKQTGKPAFAFAKSDAHFQQLLNGDNEEIAMLCDARLRVKSTQARTRAQRFIDIASRGTLPVPLNYYATETGRYGGTQQVNLQNMKRGGFLRQSIMAPEGHVIVVGDLSQIEPRVIAWLADYDELLSIFNAGGDPYATFGEQMFNVPGLNKTEHPLLRQSSKSAMLGCSYSLGWSNFAAQLLVGFLGAKPLRYTKEDAQKLGVTQAHVEKFLDWPDNIKRMSKIAHTCTDKELLIHCLAAKAIVDKYRATASPVKDFWEFLSGRIQRSLIDGTEYNHKDVLLFRKEEIVLVSGMSLKYHNLRAEEEVDEETGKTTGNMQYVYDIGPRKEKLYGGRLANHCTQSTARVVMTDAMLRVHKRYPVVGTVHDELLCVVPEAEAEEATKWVYEQMVVEPKWLPGIPLDADVGYNRRYGLAKM